MGRSEADIKALLDSAQHMVETSRGLDAMPALYAVIHAQDEEAPDVAVVARALDIFILYLERELLPLPELITELQMEVRSPQPKASGYLILGFMWLIKSIIEETGRSVGDVEVPRGEGI